MAIVQKTGYIALAAAMLLSAACSVQENHRRLSFFFDGVPNPEEVSLATAIDSSVLVSDSAMILGQANKPEVYIHEPYREKECAACHDQDRMGSRTGPASGLCYQCHNELETMYTVDHGPAAGGYCTECHSPHRSNLEHLLLRTGEDMCLQCHHAGEMSEILFHNVSEESDCIACHNPHGGENHSLLRQGACYQCHENFLENYKVVHGPVAAEKCSMCHTSHREGSEKHLKKYDQDLCLYCHDSERLLKNESHPQSGDTFCIDCHNPHATGKRFSRN